MMGMCLAPSWALTVPQLQEKRVTGHGAGWPTC